MQPRTQALLISARGPLTAGALACLRQVLARLPLVYRPVVEVDVRGVTRFGLDVVDDLARLQLAAERAGGLVQILVSGNDLPSLLLLVGLDSVLHCSYSLRVEGPA